MSSTLGVRHQQTRWFPPPLGRLGAAPVAVEAAAGVIQGAEDRLEVSKMASRENGRDFGVAFVGDVEEEDEEEEDEEEEGGSEEEGDVRRTFRLVLPESPSAEGEEGGEEEEEGDEEEEDDAAGEGCWSGDRRISRVGRTSSSPFVSGADDGARRPEEEEGGGNGTPHSNRRPRRPCSVVLDPIPGDLLRSLSSVGRISAERASLRSTPPPLADCDEPPRPLPPLHPQPRARPIAVVDPSCEGPRRRLSAPAVAGGPPPPPGGAAPLLAGAPLRHRRCSCHGAGAHGARSPRQAIDPPTLPPRRHGGAWASRDVMTTSDPDVEVLAVAEEEARGGRECRENGLREERRRIIEEEEAGERTVRKRERAKRRRRQEEEDDEEEGEEEEEEEGERSSGEAEREIRSVERSNYRKRSCSSSTTASSSTASSASTAFSLRRRHKHRKRRRRRARPLESEEEDAVPLTTEVVQDVPNPNPTPRVNPIFVWAKQDDAATILEVLCEDYDKRNRIRLTKTPNGWRAIPRTERLAAATAVSSVSQPPKDAATGEGTTASNTEGPPDPSVLLRLPLATTVPPPPRRRSRGSQAKDKSKSKESHKGAKQVTRDVGSQDENKPHEDHVDSPGQPEAYGGEGPGRPKTGEEVTEASPVAESEKKSVSKPRTIKPRDQKLGNKRVRKAPVKRAKPKRKPPVKKMSSTTPISPSQEVESPKYKKDVVAQECAETFPRREPVAKVVTRSRRKNTRVTRAITRSRARVYNFTGKVKSSKLPVVVSPRSTAPQTQSVAQEVVEEEEKKEELEKEVEEFEKEVEEVEKVEEPVSTEVTEADEAPVDKEMSSRDCESEEEVPIEDRGVGEEVTEEAPNADEGEEGAPIAEEGVGEEEAEVVGGDETEEVVEEEAGEGEESRAARVNSEEGGVQEEEDGDLESHAEAQVEDVEEVDAVAENEEVNENEITNEEAPEGEEASEGAEVGVVEGEGELVEGANVQEEMNEEDVDGVVQREEEEEEPPAEVEMEEGELPALEEEERAQVEEGEAEDETAVVEEEGEAAEEEEGEEEEEEEEDEEDDDEEEEEEEEEEEGPPKTPPPAHAASIPTLLVSQPNIVEGMQEEPADLSTQKRRGDEIDEPPPFKKVRRGHVTALPPSTRITTCPRSMLPLKEPRTTTVDPLVPAPAHSLEPFQPAPCASTEERPTESKTPQKDPLDLVFPGFEELVKAHESADAKEQWRKVSSSATSVRENREAKAETGNHWEENISMEPPVKKIKVEVEEEEEAVSDSIEPNIPIEDSHQITLKKLLSCPKVASPNPGLATSVDIVVPKPKVEIVFPSEVTDGVGKSCARSRLLELLTSPDAHKSPPPNRSTPLQRTPSPVNPIVIARPYSQPPPAVKIEPRSEEADSNCVDGKAGLELKRLKDLLGKQSAAKLALKPIALENQAPLALKQMVSPSEVSASRMPTPETQQPVSLSIQRNTPVTARAEPVRVPQPAVRSHKQTKNSHQSSIPHNQNSVRRSSGRDMNASSRVDSTSGAEQDAAAAAAAALHNMLWLPYLGQLEMAVNTGNRELLASLGNAMFGPPPAVSPSSQSATSPRALSHFPTPPPPQNPPFVHGTPFLHPSSLPPSAIADYKSRVELSQTLNLWQDIMAANASTAFNSAHQDMLVQESLERNGGANGIIGSHRQDGNINTHLQERQSPRFPSNNRKPSPVSTPLSPSHSPSADFLRYINSGVFPGGAVANPRPQPSSQNNNHFGIRYNGGHNSNTVQHASKHSFHEQKAPIRHPTPSQIYRNIESSSNQLQHTLSLASMSRPRKSPTVSMAGNSDPSQNKNSLRRQPSSSPRDEVGKIPVSSSMATATSRQKPTLTCRSLLNLLSNPRPDGTEPIPSEIIPDDSTSGARLDQHRHGHLLAALARPSNNQQDKRAIDMSRLPPIPSSLRPQVIGLDPESEYLQSTRFSNPLSGVPHSLLPTGVQPMDLSGRSGGKSSKREERVANMEVFRGQEVAATLNTASGSTHPHLWHPLFGRRPVTHGDGEQLLSMETDLEVGKQCYYLDEDHGLLDGDSDVSTTDKPITLTSLTMTAHLWPAYSPTPDTMCYSPGSVPATDPQV